MLTPGQGEALHLFDNSICPDPTAFVFLGFTVFTLLWMLYQVTLSSQSRSRSPSRGLGITVILSLSYTAILAILLLDACWLAAIYGWGLAKIAKGGGGASGGVQGLMQWMVTWLILCVTCIFLFVAFILWVVAILRTVKQLTLLWRLGPASLAEDDLNAEGPAAVDSK